MKSSLRRQPVQDPNSLQAQMNRMFENGADSPRRAEYNYFGQSCRAPSDENLHAAHAGPPVAVKKTIRSSPSKVEVTAIDEKDIKVEIGNNVLTIG
jgi:hypothetical protein